MKKLTALLLAIFCISTLAMAATTDVKVSAVQPTKKIVVKKVKKIKKVAKVAKKGVVAPVAPVAPKK
jgi:preprotein translocase subunit SecG